MKMMLKVMTVVFLLLSCEDKTDSSDTVISSGTSFGECVGYCVREMEISSESLIYRAIGRASDEYPMRINNAPMETDDWNDLISRVDFATLESFEDVIGCPDCADGGAEWIKVESSEGSKKITFEFGDTLTSIQPLINQLRLLRAQQEETIFDK